MAVLSREDFLNAIKVRIGEDDSDAAMSFIEDMTDTYDDMSSKLSEDWKTKYEKNDAEWRKRYRERFFRGDGKEILPEEVKEEQEENVEDDGKQLTFEELFKEREG